MPGFITAVINPGIRTYRRLFVDVGAYRVTMGRQTFFPLAITMAESEAGA